MNKKKSQINFALFLYSIIQLLLLSLCWLAYRKRQCYVLYLKRAQQMAFRSREGSLKPTSLDNTGRNRKCSLKHNSI